MSTRSRVLASLATGVTALLGLALLGLGFGACDQGEGERCQRNQDCASGLQCNQGTHLCQAGVSDGGVGGIDAPLDADEPDAPTDAAVDAPPAL